MHQYSAVPLLSDLKSLPNLTVDNQYVYEWWQIVFDVKQRRPELETVIMNGMIIAIHSPECEFFLCIVMPLQLCKYIRTCTYFSSLPCACVALTQSICDLEDHLVGHMHSCFENEEVCTYM